MAGLAAAAIAILAVGAACIFCRPKKFAKLDGVDDEEAAQHDSQHEQESMKSQAHSEDAELSENDLATSVEESRHST